MKCKKCGKELPIARDVDEFGNADSWYECPECSKEFTLFNDWYHKQTFEPLMSRYYLAEKVWNASRDAMILENFGKTSIIVAELEEKIAKAIERLKDVENKAPSCRCIKALEVLEDIK